MKIKRNKKYLFSEATHNLRKQMFFYNKMDFFETKL